MKPSGSVVEGSPVDAFEAEFAELMGGQHCVAVHQDISPLYLTLRHLGIGPGDEVIVSAFGPEESVTPIRLAGASEVFADIYGPTFCLDPDAVRAAVSPRTAAVVVGHRFGHPAAMGALTVLAARHGLALVEDATEAPLASLDGRPVGTFGTAAAFGRCVMTVDPTLARALRASRTQHQRPGDDWALQERATLDRLAGLTARRRANARVLDSALTGVLVPPVAAGAHHVYQRYAVRVPGNGRPDRDAFARALAARGVRGTVPVRTPVHRLPGQRAAQELPRTEFAAAQTLALPVDPHLAERDVERIVAACNALGGLL